MIYTILHDGLGNQLFQLMTLLSYSLLHKIPFKIINTQQNGYRNLYYDTLFFNLKENLVSPEEIKDKKIKLYQEPFFHYQALPKDKNDFFIQGFFNSYKYFDTNFNLIKQKYFKLPESINSKINDLFNKISVNFPEHQIYSLHLRWGDYQTFHYNHPILPEEYYLKTMEKINQENQNNKIFLIFCDPNDKIRIEEKFKTLQNYATVFLQDIIEEKLEDYQELLLMSKCHSHIIANSTFSWWGAYLNPNKNKKVYYPSIWFGDNLIINKKYQLKDLIPKDWIKINLKVDNFIQ